MGNKRSELVSLMAEILMSDLRYRIEISPLSDADGGGFVATVPDLPCCMRDGETPMEAALNVQDAIACWIEAARDMGRPIFGMR